MGRERWLCRYRFKTDPKIRRVAVGSRVNGVFYVDPDALGAYEVFFFYSRNSHPMEFSNDACARC